MVQRELLKVPMNAGYSKRIEAVLRPPEPEPAPPLERNFC